MNIWEFYNRHWFLAFITIICIYHVLTFPMRLIQLWIRHRNIIKAGWPPNYLDADGDGITKEDKVTE